MPEIVVVCTANICRSPVAKALLQQRLQSEEAGTGAETRWRVRSAGTWADYGQPASAFSVELMAEQGLDISKDRSRPVGGALLQEADLVLCMEAGHAEGLGVEFPDQAHKIYLLSEMAGPPYSISDPYGGPRSAYERMVAELSSLIDAGLPRIKELALANERRRRSDSTSNG